MLTERERSLLDYVYRLQYRYVEVARLWDVDPSTVRKAHNRALKKLRDQMVKDTLTS
ncbi:sigma factor-like helix-turn-helix DNA-binding protein [Desulfuribacillus stibiiarsenatis]|uniref:sigma factor-like helix-turn-helix DNA-binding protein n=1 Tax=Desulfuribacillus stibiiarsenatis TaxID=1390249 RepID=UPI0009F36A93